MAGTVGRTHVWIGKTPDRPAPPRCRWECFDHTIDDLEEQWLTKHWHAVPIGDYSGNDGDDGDNDDGASRLRWWCWKFGWRKNSPGADVGSDNVTPGGRWVFVGSSDRGKKRAPDPHDPHRGRKSKFCRPPEQQDTNIEEGKNLAATS